VVIAQRKGSAAVKGLKCLLLTLVLVWGTAGPAWSVGVGDRAPDFSLTSLDGQKLVLSHLMEQRPVLLYFWATWCYQCEEEWPRLLEIASGSGRQGVIVIGINVGVNDSARRADAYRKKHGLTFPIAFDQATRVTHSYGVITVPTNLIIDRQGTVRFRGASLPENLETYLGMSGQ
jgi:peroxiredoxin